MSSKNKRILATDEFIININKLAHNIGGKKLFAAEVDVSYDTVRRWCLGEFMPGGLELVKISKKFDVSIDWLVNGKESTAGFMCGWNEEVQEACRAVKEILESKNKGIVPTLLSNLAAFRQAVRNDDASKDKRINHLEEDVKRLRKLLEQDFDGAACVEDGSRLKKKLM